MTKREEKNKRGYRPETKTNEIIKIASGIRKQSDDFNEDVKYPQNIINISNQSKECNQTRRLHPTQKPVELLEYLIRTYTLEGETVLDTCMGSGSTGVACINLKRKFIGIEKDDKYFEIAKKRIEDAIQDKKRRLF